jgi:hypothetical protein
MPHAGNWTKEQDQCLLDAKDDILTNDGVRAYFPVTPHAFAPLVMRTLNSLGKNDRLVPKAGK